MSAEMYCENERLGYDLYPFWEIRREKEDRESNIHIKDGNGNIVGLYSIVEVKNASN